MSLALFLYIGFEASSDLRLQAEFLVDCIEERFLPEAFLHYLFVALVTGFSTDVAVVLVGTAVVLSAAVAAKFLVSLHVGREWLGPDAARNPRADCMLLIGSAALVVLFSFPLPGEHWYVSGFPPVVWHNGTTITLLPFAVLLFHYSARYLISPERGLPAPIAILVVLNVLIKPSFFFCFAPIFPLFVLSLHGPKKAFLLSCVPVLVGGAIMLGQYAWLYHSSDYSRVAGSGSISLGWFRPWSTYAENIPLVIANAVVLPLLFFAGYPRILRTDVRLSYALALLALAVLIYAVVYEQGDREFHGNFGWQTTICNYLLHLSVAIAFLRIKLREFRLNPYDYLLLAVFGIQTLLGVAYIVRFVLTGQFR
jgi:hypothetical protein